jgi:WD40 repeat protein
MIDTIRRSGLSLRILCFTLVATALTYACGGDRVSNLLPPPTPIPTTITGGGQTDTVGVILAQPLGLELRDSTGKVIVGATVNFTSIDGPDSLLVSPVSPQNFWGVASDVTDAQGRVKVLVKTGPKAGTARVVIAVPALGFADTVSFTVKAGAAAKFTISPRDTSIALGTSFTLKAQPTDRYGNPIASAVPTFSATGVTVSSAGLVTGASATARARVVVSSQGVSDSTTVSVVPKFPMVINRNNSLVLINSDGTGATALAATTNFFPMISPSSVAATPSVVYVKDPGSGAAVWVAQPNSVPRALLPGAAGSNGGPRLSPDGAWVYFVRDRQSIWRVKLDGTGLDSLGSFSWSRQFPAPTISPDGGSVAIDDGNTIKIIDVVTKTSRTLPVKCGAPRYSPDGAFFACVGGLDMSVVRTDGTGLRVVADLFRSDPDDVSGVDWSPDGKWLVTTTTYDGAVLVEVSSGTLIPLSALGIGYPQVGEASFVR